MILTIFGRKKKEFWVEALLSTLTALMEPFLMVFLGAIIGTIVMAMFMPIFNMGSLAS